MYQSNYDSNIGSIYLYIDGEYLIGLYFNEQEFKDEIIINNKLKIFLDTKTMLDKYFKGEEVSFDNLKIKISGTDFQLTIYNILKTIPYGKVITYKEIAEIIAQKRGIKKMSAQAVGSAVGSNKLSIVIPCHRVIGSNNLLGGYSGGIDKKLLLLENEGIDTINLKRTT